MTRRGDGACPWWRDAVIYQVYVRSFADGNGDGIGDLAGVRERLPYLVWLGVDAIWLTPFYRSPMADGGYDVADYRDVDPMFGALADLGELIGEAHERGIRVIVDIVPNHTSVRHEWFRAAVAGGPRAAERDLYLFRPGRGADGELPPNNWRSVFGGPAWTRVTEPDGAPGDWYLHLFAPEQADLNWRNSRVGDEFVDVLRFWLDRGVDGFRIDVAMGLFKAEDLPDIPDDSRFPHEDGFVSGGPVWGQAEVHDVYRRWRRVLDSYPGERMAVGEVWTDTPTDLARYLAPDELHQAFNFNWLLAPWSAAAFREVIDRSLAATAPVGATTTWVLSNHDVERTVTRYGGGARGFARARAAALTMLALPGSAYLYQGEELGLAEVTDLPDEARQDPIWERSGHTERGRDGCRVPMPWSGETPPYGFCPAGVRPWLPMPAGWSSVESQAADAGSTLELYRRALRLRRDHPALGAGTVEVVDSDSDVLAFERRPGFACVLNCGEAPIPLPRRAEALLTSGELSGDGKLPGDTVAWLRIHQ